MPLTAKGKKIKAAMTEQYGKKKGTSVFYASINKGNIKGAEGGKVKGHAKAAAVGMHLHRSAGEENGGVGGKVMAGGENRAHVGGGVEQAISETEAAKSVHPMHHAKGAGSGRW